MATIDWPTDSVFKPAEVTFGSTTSKSGFQGFYSGDRHSVSHLSDRHTMTLKLPPVASQAGAGRRSALLQALDSTGDFVRMPAFHRRYPLGKFAGTPTVKTSAIAGAQTITLTGVLNGTSLIASGVGSFEVDANANGVGDGWNSYSSGTSGTVTRTVTTSSNVVHGSYVQTVESTALGGTTSDRMGVVVFNNPCTEGLVYTLSTYAWRASGPGCGLGLLLSWSDSGGTFMSSSGSTAFTLTTTPTRYSTTATAPAGAATFSMYLFAHSSSPADGAVKARFEAAQIERGQLSDWAGSATLLAGDFIAVGGNLLVVGYAGAQESGLGDLVVPLALPLQADVASGAAVTYSAPTGLWMLDTDGIALDFSPGSVQQGIALPFRQVVA